MKKSSIFAVLLFVGCTTLKLPVADKYDVVFIGDDNHQDFDSVEIRGDWVILNGYKYVPRTAIQMITPRIYPTSPPPGLGTHK